MNLNPYNRIVECYYMSKVTAQNLLNMFTVNGKCLKLDDLQSHCQYNEKPVIFNDLLMDDEILVKYIAPVEKIKINIDLSERN